MANAAKVSARSSPSEVLELPVSEPPQRFRRGCAELSLKGGPTWARTAALGLYLSAATRPRNGRSRATNALCG